MVSVFLQSDVKQRSYDGLEEESLLLLMVFEGSGEVK